MPTPAVVEYTVDREVTQELESIDTDLAATRGSCLLNALDRLDRVTAAFRLDDKTGGVRPWPSTGGLVVGVAGTAMSYESWVAGPDRVADAARDCFARVLAPDVVFGRLTRGLPATGGPVRIEVRPAPAPSRPHDVARPPVGPILLVERLYDGQPPRFDLGACGPVCDALMRKRGWAYRLAHEHGVRTGGAHIVHLNRAGFATVADFARELQDTREADAFVVDAAPSVRQVVVGKAGLVPLFGRILPADGTATTLLVRDFLRGDAGAISTAGADGGAVVEWSPDGLLAQNRGWGRARRLFISSAGVPSDDTSPLAGPAADIVQRFTGVLDDALPGVHVEWALADGQAWFVDFSAPAQALGTAVTALSPGTARGPSVFIALSESLIALSDGAAVSVTDTGTLDHEVVDAVLDTVLAADAKPVVVAPRPLAVFAFLLDHVAGFVFEDGSAMSHLAILLRERGVPAVVGRVPATNGWLEIADNEVRAVSRPS